MEEIKEEVFYTSYSKMDTYKSCPQKYKYNYIDKIESKGLSRPYYIGTHIHKLIELYYVHRTPKLLEEREGLLHNLATMLNIPNEGPEAEQYAKDLQEAHEDTLTWREYLTEVIAKEYAELSEDNKNIIGLNYIDDLAHIMAQYEYYYTNDAINFLDIEHDKRCGMGNYNNKKVILKYICDGIVQLVNNKIYILEHKSYSKDPMTFEDTWLNTQTAIYVSALRAQGYEIEGVLWDNIKSIAPKRPNILKSGAYGKQDSGVTLFSFIDYDTIMQGPEAVIQFMSNLPKEVYNLGIENNKDNFLSRHITVFNEHAVDEMLSDSTAVLGEITKDNPLIYRNIGWTCNGCQYKPLCRAHMLCEDEATVLSTMYKPKED